MSILIVGANGSMGRRYRAIMGYLGKIVSLVDKDDSMQSILAEAKNSTGVIIATPTDTHAEYIRQFSAMHMPILCEKPITKNIDELKALMGEVAARRVPFRMMMQYEMLADPARIGPSRYAYYNSGKDGLFWDCIQIIGLARSSVTLSNDISQAVWRCMINGKAINPAHMDAAYIGYVQKWFKSPSQDVKRLIHIHEKTAAAEKGLPYGASDNGLHRNPGQIH